VRLGLAWSLLLSGCALQPMEPVASMSAAAAVTLPLGIAQTGHGLDAVYSTCRAEKRLYRAFRRMFWHAADNACKKTPAHPPYILPLAYVYPPATGNAVLSITLRSTKLECTPVMPSMRGMWLSSSAW